MNIDVSSEDQELLEKLVQSGRFRSISEAVHEGIVQFANEEAPGTAWKQQLDAGIDQGMADVAAGRYRPAGDFLTELKSRYGS